MGLANLTVIIIEWETILTLQLIVILFVIALLHFYWAFGGKKGLNLSVPSKEDGTLLFLPNSFQCALVGFGLLLVILFIYLGMRQLVFSNWVFKNGLLILGGIFMLRSVGDLNYVGFFKKVKATDFGKLDTKYYSPLCLLISGTFFLIANTIQP